MRIVRYNGPGKPAKSATRRGQSNIFQVFDDSQDLAEGSEVLSGIVALGFIGRNTKLPSSHPMYGKRLIEPLISGFPGDLFLQPTGKFNIYVNGQTHDYDDWRQTQPV